MASHLSYGRMNEFVAARPIEQIVDTLRYPLDDRSNPDTLELVRRSREALAEHGSFSLVGFIKPEVLYECVSEIQPLIAHHAYRHTQTHNVYFTDADGITLSDFSLREGLVIDYVDHHPDEVRAHEVSDLRLRNRAPAAFAGAFFLSNS